MVAGHADAPFSHFIYLFHMAVFYMVSGFLYSEKNSFNFNTVMEFVWRKIKSLWLPFFVCSAFFVIFNNVFIRLNIYTGNEAALAYITKEHVVIHSYIGFEQTLKEILKCVFFNNNSELGGAFWFIRDLFIISIAYCVLSFVIKKSCQVFHSNEKVTYKVIDIVQLVISILALAVGYYFSVKGIAVGGVGKIGSCYSLFYIGHLLGSRFKDKLCMLNGWKWLVIIIITFFLLMVMNHRGSISIANNRYENPLFLIACSLLGWLWLYGLAFLTQRLKNAQVTYPIYNLLLYIGQHTIAIVLLHFLAFKIVNAIACAYYDYPTYCMAAFPTLSGGIGAWWILYTIIGLAIPLLAYGCYFWVKQIIIRKIG